MIEDNGIGLPKNFNCSESTSLGMKLIETISKQIAAEYKFESSDIGTIFKFSFEKSEKKGASSSFLKSVPGNKKLLGFAGD